MRNRLTDRHKGRDSGRDEVTKERVRKRSRTGCLFIDGEKARS